MEETTPTPQEETTVKKVQLSARILPDDKTFIENFVKGYPSISEGYSALAKLTQAGAPVDTFTFQVENDELKAEIEKLKTELGEARQSTATKQNCYLMEFSPALVDKLTALRRYLKQKEQIPADSSELEFVQNFVNHAMQNYINDKYDFLNR